MPYTEIVVLPVPTARPPRAPAFFRKSWRSGTDPLRAFAQSINALHGMRSMLPCETHSTATRRPIPNGFDFVDVDLVQMACRSARMGAQTSLAGEPWAGSRRSSGTGRNRLCPSRGSPRPPGHARPAPPCFLHLPQAPQLWTLGSCATQPLQVESLSTRLRRRLATARPQHGQ